MADNLALNGQVKTMFFVRDGILSVADYNLTRVGVVVVVVVVVTDFKKWITFLCFDRFGSYLVGSCTRVRRFTSYPIFVIRPTQPAQPAYRPKSEKRA